MIEPQPGDARLLAEVTAKAQADGASSLAVRSWNQHIVGEDGYCHHLAVSLLAEIVAFPDVATVMLPILAFDLRVSVDDVAQALRLLEKHGLVVVKELGIVVYCTTYAVNVQHDNLVAITYEMTPQYPPELFEHRK